MRRSAARTPAFGVVWAAALILAGCTTVPGAGADGPGGTDSAGGDGSSGFVVLSGTGSYAIGEDAPYGGYQLSGEPAEQPAGCTWAILDADGQVSFEDQGSYVFLTDVAEAVTFETNGCPDWEQFE